MTLSSGTITSRTGARTKSARVGRGNAGYGGTTGARGTKGQKARSGGKSGNARRTFKRLLQSVPKLRGFKSLTPKPTTITLEQLERAAKGGETITPWTLGKARIVARPENGVKIVGKGEVKKKISVADCFVSASAKEAIEKAGGTVTVRVIAPSVKKLAKKTK